MHSVKIRCFFSIMTSMCQIITKNSQIVSSNWLTIKGEIIILTILDTNRMAQWTNCKLVFAAGEYAAVSNQTVHIGERLIVR